MVAADWQFQLAGLTFGSGTPYRVSELGHDKPEIRTQDADLPGQDGIRMGRDFLGGTVLAFSLGVMGNGPDQVLDRVAELRKVWRGDTARHDPGAVQKLVYRRPGAPDRSVYGRPRRFTPASLENAASGWVPVEMDFQAVDGLFYSDAEHVLTIAGDAIEYSSTAGVTTPHAPPVTLAEATLPEDTATNEGDAGTWPVFVFHGPREKPGVSYVNESRGVQLAMILGDGRSVTVDTRPWRRTVLRDDGASLAGALRGSRLSELALSPGDTQLAFDGRDDTLTSSVDITWRDANSSL